MPTRSATALCLSMCKVLRATNSTRIRERLVVFTVAVFRTARSKTNGMQIRDSNRAGYAGFSSGSLKHCLKGTGMQITGHCPS